MAWTKGARLKRARLEVHQSPPIPTEWKGVFAFRRDFCAHVCAHTCTMGFWKWGPQEWNDVTPGIYSVDGRRDENGPQRSLWELVTGTLPPLCICLQRPWIKS